MLDGRTADNLELAILSGKPGVWQLFGCSCRGPRGWNRQCKERAACPGGVGVRRSAAREGDPVHLDVTDGERTGADLTGLGALVAPAAPPILT